MRNLIAALFKQVAVRNMEVSRCVFLLSGREQDVLWLMGDPLFAGTHTLTAQPALTKHLFSSPTGSTVKLLSFAKPLIFSEAGIA